MWHTWGKMICAESEGSASVCYVKAERMMECWKAGRLGRNAVYINNYLFVSVYTIIRMGINSIVIRLTFLIEAPTWKNFDFWQRIAKHIQACSLLAIPLMQTTSCVRYINQMKRGLSCALQW